MQNKTRNAAKIIHKNHDRNLGGERTRFHKIGRETFK